MIEGLIKKSKLELEKTGQITNTAGNCPHYPVLALFDSEISRRDFESIFENLRRIWPRALKHIASYKYSVSENGVEYISFKDNAVVRNEEFLESLDNTKKAREVFASMQQWNVYNIIDTTRFETAEDFADYYYAYKAFNETIIDSHKNMLIVLLNDSSAKRDVARGIRAFLSDKSDYEAVVIIANRDRNNQMYDMSELHRIVGNIIVLSNNDSVGADKFDYNNRIASLYDRTPHIVSYILLDKPIYKITLQLIESIFAESAKVASETKNFDNAAWAKRFGFVQSKCEICENFIRRVEPNVDKNIFLHLPMKTLPEKLNVENMQYSQLKNFIFDDVFKGFVANYCENQLSQDFDTDEVFEAFREFVLSSFTYSELLNLGDDIIDIVVDNLGTGVISENSSINDYFKQCVQHHLRKNIFYPRFKKILKNLRKEAAETKRVFESMRNEFKTFIPLKMDDTLGTYYSKMVVSFCQTSAGEQAIKNILCAGNSEQDIAEKIFDFFQKIVEEHQKIFSMSFIEEWSQRLGQSGDMIYNKISNQLTMGADEAIRLCGNYALRTKLKVIMLHTGGGNGGTQTELYGHVKETFKDDNLVHYFNTGYDDAMEAISFIECKGADLII